MRSKGACTRRPSPPIKYCVPWMRAAAACCDCARRPPVPDRTRLRASFSMMALVVCLGLIGATPTAEQSPTPAPAATNAPVAAPTSTATPLLKRDVTTYAGTGVEAQNDGPLLAATFADVRFIAADPDRKSFFVTDKNEIRELTNAGAVVTIAGSSAIGIADGTRGAA